MSFYFKINIDFTPQTQAKKSKSPKFKFLICWKSNIEQGWFLADKILESTQFLVYIDV